MLDDLMSLFDGISKGAAPVIERDELECGLIVSTVDSWDLGPETAIIDAAGVHPVERYDCKANALVGHKVWIEKINKGLREITKLGYGSFAEEQDIKLVEP